MCFSTRLNISGGNNDLDYISTRCHLYGIHWMDLQLIQSWYQMIYDKYIYGKICDDLRNGLMAVLLWQLTDNRQLSQSVFQTDESTFILAQQKLTVIMHDKFNYL